MGYDAGKLTLARQSIAGVREFSYTDTGGETAGTYQGAGYFANAKKVGAKVGDSIVIHNTSATPEVWRGVFTVVQDTGATSGTVRLDTGQP